MKKLILSILLSVFISSSAFAGDYYTVGINCYNRGLYDKAIQNLEHAVRISPKNVNARYYLAQAYLAEDMIQDAQEQYSRIILLSPNSEAGKLSQKGIYIIEQAYRDAESPSKKATASSSENYLAYVIENPSSIKRWAVFPISVYIEQNKHRNLAIQACNQWATKTGVVKFNFVTSSNAQITIKFQDSLESNSTKENFLAGTSKPYYKGDDIIKYDVKILMIDPSTKVPLSDNMVYFTVLHELGHALGFKGHSPVKEDVMYASATSAKTQLTQRDINTMKMLYGYDKKTLIAMLKGSGDVGLSEALSYVKKFPNRAISWENLGDAYKSRNQYTKAIEAYKKAVSVEPDKADAYALLGNAYAKVNEFSNAYPIARKACDLDKKNISYVYQLAEICTNNGQRAVGLSYINQYIKANPEAAGDAKLIRLRNMMF